MNIQKACGSQSGCEVTCQNPQSSMSCTVFPGSFTDGTPCGIGGVCNSGKCDLDNAGNVALDWIKNHKEIVIPVAIIVGVFILFCLFRCCCYGDTRGYNNITKTTYIVPGQQPYQGQYNAQPPYYPPPPNQPPYYAPPSNGWVDPAQYNGGGAGYAPQQPLPVYTQHDPHLATAQPDSYELNNANNWQNRGTPAPQSPSPGYQMPSSPIPGHGQTPTSPAPGYGHMPSPSPAPATYPTPPTHGSNQRPYNEGVI